MVFLSLWIEGGWVNRAEWFDPQKSTQSIHISSGSDRAMVAILSMMKYTGMDVYVCMSM